MKQWLQTAVDWNLSQTKELQASDFQQALTMEKEQIEDAYGDALNGHRVNYCDRNDYYNKKYKGGDK
jgi:hypothetical protein